MKKTAACVSAFLFLRCAVAHTQGEPAFILRTKAETVVQEVVQATLKRGEGEVQGYKTSTWVPINATDRKKVVDLGSEAVGPLAERVNSTVPFVQLIAVQLLGSIGGRESVAPLTNALRSDRWVVVRMQALSSLTNTPEVTAVPIIQGMKKDEDPRVRQRAEEILNDYYGLKGAILKH